MIYSVRARPKTAELSRLWTLLNDGTVEKQEPDGREILASMKRALLKGGIVEWHETCFCNPPLDHERKTIYNQFFTEMDIRPQANTIVSGGDPFWQYLREHSKPGAASRAGTNTTGLKHVPLRIL